MNRTAIATAVGLFAVTILLSAGRASAYSTYTGSQCAVCHPGFQSKGPLHDLHTAITRNCDMCHPNGPGSTPVSTWKAKDTTAFSCLGCHGRDYGPFGKQSAGLRLHHINSGVTVCGTCHASDPTPMAESTPPPHYSRTDVIIAGVCADNLDNDGDLLYDLNDADCLTPVEPGTWGRIKNLYR